MIELPAYSHRPDNTPVLLLIPFVNVVFDDNSKHRPVQRPLIRGENGRF